MIGKIADKARLPLAIAIIIAGVVLFSLYRSLSKESANNTDGYETITAVPGISFEVRKSYLDSAQAVLEISENVNFLDYQTYTYKNGTDTYLLFNITNHIVIVKKGTDFHLEDGIENLKYKSLNGIWFTPTDKATTSSQKISVPVTAEVLITNKVYNDFYGTLSTITDGETEYAMFVGMTKKNTGMVEHITNTFCLSNTEDNIGETYVVDLGNDVPKTDPVGEVVKEEPIKEAADEEEPKPVEEPTIEPIEVVEEPVKAKPTEETSVEIEPAVEVVEEPEEASVITVTDNGKETFKVSTNQQTVERTSDKAYSSTIYSMLNIGDTGYTVLRSDSVTYEETYVCPSKILDDKATKKEIEKYIKSGRAYYTEMTPQPGCHFEACVYDVKFTTDDTYLNISLKGFDGERLVYQGLSYTPRTYDIIYSDSQIGWNNGRIVFYEVPNGCKGYCLQFGDGNEEDIKPCYYKVEK